MFSSLSNFFSQRFKSLGYAFNGLKILLRTQIHAQIHFLATCLVVFLGFLFQLAWYEWGFLITALALVWITETINTSIEFLTDLIEPNYNEKAGKVKDLAAGAVLLAAIFAIVIGLIIFVPKIQRIW